MRTKALSTIALSFLIIIAASWKTHTVPQPGYEKQDYWQLQSPYSQRIFDTLTLRQKVAQLFMVPVYPDDPQSIAQVENLIKNYNIGGIIFFGGSPWQIARLSKHFQSISKIPLLIAIDAEWGAAMRADSLLRFPYQMTMGAIDDNRLIYKTGKLIGWQLREMGINVNFAPVADINNNPENPVIGVRSFGENPANVASKSYAYMQGLRDAGVLPVAKHFPGHGDTDRDSHLELPVIPHDWQRLYTVELFPFRQLIRTGLPAVMVAHLYIPALDDALNTPATLSRKIVRGVLRDSLGFNGLVFTDALNMQGVAKYYGPGEASIRALQAGCDVLLMPPEPGKAIERVIQAVNYGELRESIIDSAAMRVLKAKALLKLWEKPQINPNNLPARLNNDSIKVIIEQLYRNAVTIVKNDDSLVPVTRLERHRIAAVFIGDGKPGEFLQYLGFYTKVDRYAIDKNASYEQFKTLRQKLAGYDIVIVGIGKTNVFRPPAYGITENTLWFVARLAEQTNVILDVFAPPYALDRFPNLQKVRTIIVSYEDTPQARRNSAQVIFGGFGAKGRLPVSTKIARAGTGISTPHIRINYKPAAELGFDTRILKRIDTIVQNAIDSGAFPGCQILAIKDTSVIFYKAYGYYTYNKRQPVTLNTIYDIASITKVAATTLALMKLYEQGKFDIHARLSDYLPGLDTTNKANIKIIDVLTHQARLYPWIPFYLHTYLPHSKLLNPKIYSRTPKPGYHTKVADNLYISDTYRDTMYREIYQSRLLRRKRYRYSDLGFYLFQKIIEQQTGTTLDSFVTREFYQPLGAYTTRFNPLRYFPKSRIAPTENDTYFRHQLVQGYVHDYGAAMLGGVAGHAGLFSDANDLGKIFQMLLQMGYYADRRYLQPETIKLFTTKPFRKNHRALGFDSKNGDEKSIAAPSASSRSYGHTGFTGTMVWVDPQYNLIYIFLSNRIYPSIKNPKINTMRVRTRIHQVFYDAMAKQ